MSLEPMHAAATPPFPPPLAPVEAEVTAGTLLSRTFSTWWSNVLRFSALTLVAFVPAVVVGGIAAAWVIGYTAATKRPGFLGAEGVVIAAVVVALLGTYVVQLAGVTQGVVQHLAGRPVRLGPMLATGFRRAAPLLGVMVLSGIIVLGGFLLLVVPGIILACGLAVAIPAVLVEGIGPLEALARSRALTRGRRVAIFGAWVVVYVVQLAVGQATQRVLPLLLPGVVATILGAMVNVVFAALPAVLPAVAYHDLRTSREGSVDEDLVRVFE